MSADSPRDLYRIDDLLLRAGAVGFLLVLAVSAGVVVVALATAQIAESTGRIEPGLAALVHHAPVLTPAFLCPFALLAAGFAMRRREKRIAAVWRLLQHNAEISVAGLIANSDFRRRDLDRAVRFLNNRGLGHYLWDRETDTIQDARLRSSSLHVEKCDGCGAEIALDVPVGFREVPRCPHCCDLVDVDALERRRREALEALRAEHRPAPRSAGTRPTPAFSIAVFLVLLFVFWPAAVGYAWLKWQAGA